MDMKKTILVVDDDQDVVESFTMILESAGYIVAAADSSDMCREMLKALKPDLIILDIMMETITDGFNLGIDLKEDPAYEAIPIVIVSSIEQYTGFPIDTEYLKVDEFLEKPLQPSVLLDTIRKLTD